MSALVESSCVSGTCCRRQLGSPFRTKGVPRFDESGASLWGPSPQKCDNVGTLGNSSSSSSGSSSSSLLVVVVVVVVVLVVVVVVVVVLVVVAIVVVVVVVVVEL